MVDYENTSLWKSTLGKQGDKKVENLRVSYNKFREHMEGLLKEVAKDFPNLTDHSIDHVDYLWKIASLITGDNYPINPLEGYILGCSFLIHDAVLSYKAFGGKEALRDRIEWKDCYEDIRDTQYDIEDWKQKIDFKVIRQLHANNCGEILFRQFVGMDGNSHYLLSDDEMREHYGQLIGDIASSHHWETERLSELSSQVNALASFPADWTIHPRKLACILRCADAAAIDSGRAPDYLFRLLHLNDVSRDHWVSQNRLGLALDDEDKSKLVITSTHAFEEKDYAAWNVAYDAVKVIDEELEKCQYILSEHEQFQVKSVAGAKSKKALSSLIKTSGWMPSDVKVHISDVSHLIKTLGGRELYGKEDLQFIVLRELIQNARDAIKARRHRPGEEEFVGKINVNVEKRGDNVVLFVTDDGVGMSLDTISHSLLNFGSSFWHDDSVNIEFPGLKASGFKSAGQFGIGFFSVFMIAESVVIETRKYTEGVKDAHLVKFPSGLTLAPIFANCTSTSTLYSTVVSLTLKDEYKIWPSEYVARRNKIGETSFNVPFSAMLGTLVAGLDVDVYYQEFGSGPLKIHQRIDAKELDKRAWLRQLSLADYQHDKELDTFIENNYQRLQFLHDEHQGIAGLAAIGTRFAPKDDFLGGTTVGGLLTGLHSRTGEYWIGIIEHTLGGAKRGGDVVKAPANEIEAWVNKQVEELNAKTSLDIFTRFRLQLAMQHFNVDPINIAVAFCAYDTNPKHNTVYPLDKLVGQLIQGKKLIFVDSHFSANDENGGHGDVYLDFGQVRGLLNADEILYLPIMNSGFLSFKLKDGVPENNCGFIDCLYRKAELMGYKICFSFIKDYVRNNLGMIDRAIVMEVKEIRE